MKKKPTVLTHFYYQESSQQKTYVKYREAGTQIDISRLTKQQSYWRKNEYGVDTWEKKRIVISHWEACYNQENFKEKMIAFIQHLITSSFELFVLDEKGQLISVSSTKEICRHLTARLIEPASQMRERLNQTLQTTNNDGVPLSHYVCLDSYKLEASLHEYEDDENSKQTPFTYSLTIPSSPDEREKILRCVATEVEKIKHLRCSLDFFEQQQDFFQRFPSLEVLELEVFSVRFSDRKEELQPTLIDKINQGGHLTKLVLINLNVPADYSKLKYVKDFSFKQCSLKKNLTLPKDTQALSIDYESGLNLENISPHINALSLKKISINTPLLKSLQASISKTMEIVKLCDFFASDNTLDLTQYARLQEVSLKESYKRSYNGSELSQLLLPKQLKMLEISNIKNIRSLDLRNTELKKLIFYSNRHLSELKLPTTLKSFSAKSLDGLSELDFSLTEVKVVRLSHLNNLKKLVLPASLERFDCHKLSRDQFDFSHTQVRTVKIGRFNGSELDFSLTEVRAVTLSHLNNLKKLVLPASLEWFDGYRLSCDQFDFSHTQVRTVKISRFNGSELELAASFLKYVEIHRSRNLKRLDLSRCFDLKTLVVKNCKSLAEIKLPIPSKLENLVVENAALLSLDLSQYHELKTLEVSRCFSLAEIKLPVPSKLENLVMENAGLLSLDLSQHHELKTLEVSSCSSLSEIKLPNDAKIESLKIKNVLRLKKIDLDNIPLKDLTLNNCALYDLKLPASLEKLTILTGCLSIDNFRKEVSQRWLSSIVPLTVLLPKQMGIEIVEFKITNEKEIEEVCNCYCKIFFDHGHRSSEKSSVPTHKDPWNPMDNPDAAAIEFDANTYSDPTEQIFPQRYIYQYQSSRLVIVDESKYRENILPILEQSNNYGLRFAGLPANEDFTATPVSLVQQTALLSKSSRQPQYLGQIDVPRRKWVPLTMKTHDDHLVAIHSLSGAVKGEQRYNPQTQQYEIRLDYLGQETKRMISIQYSFVTDATRSQQYQQVKPEVPKIFRQALDLILAAAQHKKNGYPEGFRTLAMKIQSFLFGQVSQQDLIEDFKCYFQDAENERLDENVAYYDSLQALLAEKLEQTENEVRGLVQWLLVLVQNKGACRHRAQLFVLLCQYLEIPARVITNQTHAYVEYLTKQRDWQQLNLGGARINRKPILVSLQGQKDLLVALSILEKSGGDALPLQSYAFKPYFVPAAARHLAKHKQNYLEALSQEGHSGLLEVFDDSEAEALYAALFQRAQKDGQQTAFIDSWDSVSALYEDCCIEANRIYSVPGPLANILQSGGVLVIDWRRIPAHQISSLKSLLDTPPTFLPPGQTLSLPVSKALKIINLTTPEQELPGPALSRMTPWPRPPQTLCRPSLSAPRVNNKEQMRVRIDLYNSPFWQQYILGHIDFSKEGMAFKAGLLLHWLQESPDGVGLMDAPVSDPEFQRFVRAVNIERQVRINGKVHDIAPGFVIRCVEPPEQANNLTVIDADQVAWDKDDLFLLNANNVPQLFSQTVVDDSDKTKKLLSQPGWLTQALQHSSSGQQHVIVLTEPLAPSVLREIQDSLQQSKNIKFVDLTAAKAKVPSSQQFSPPPRNPLILSHDPYFEAAYYAQKYKVVEENIVDINGESSWGELFEKLDIDGVKFDVKKQSGGRLGTVSYQIQPILQKLMKGETVILRGTLSRELYQQLATLFLPQPFLRLNGQFVPIKGRLVVCSTPVADPLAVPCSFQGDPKQSLATPWPYYRELLATEYQQHYAALLPVNDDDKDLASSNDPFDRFFETVQSFLSEVSQYLPLGQYGAPPTLRISYARLSAMMAAWFDPQEQRDNPMKPILGYDFKKDSEAYALLNVLAKLCFSSGKKNTDKQQRLQTYPQDSDQFFWRRANCFSACQLRRALGYKADKQLDIVKLGPPQQWISSLLTKLDPNPRVPPLIPSLASAIQKKPQQKNQKRLVQCLAQQRCVFLQGPPGSGKTTAAAHYVQADKNKRHAYWGEKRILDWLNSDKEEPCLILDEANMSKPGTWDFLSPLITPSLSSSSSLSLSYRGKLYPLKNHKVIFTGNPAHYSARTYHAVLQDVHTLYFNEWSDAMLLERILEPLYADLIQQRSLSDERDALKLLLQAYRLAQQIDGESSVSLRGLQQIMLRWQQQVPLQTAKEALYTACMIEWGDLNLQKKDNFTQQLRALFSVDNAAIIKCQQESNNRKQTLQAQFAKLNEKQWQNKPYYCSPTMLACAEAVAQDLEINHQRSQHDAVLGKLGTVVEGPSGVGKSELMKALLEALGYQQYQLPDQEQNSLQNAPLLPGKVYCQVTMNATGDEVKQLLEQAYDQGWVVILDELNANPHAAAILNDVMTGKRNGEAITPKKPGFYVLASQNYSHVLGREALSEDVRNRFHNVQVSDYCRQDWHEILKQAIPTMDAHDRNRLIDTYEASRKAYPRMVNARTFFRALPKIRDDFINYQKMDFGIEDFLDQQQLRQDKGAKKSFTRKISQKNNNDASHSKPSQDLTQDPNRTTNNNKLVLATQSDKTLSREEDLSLLAPFGGRKTSDSEPVFPRKNFHPISSPWKKTKLFLGTLGVAVGLGLCFSGIGAAVGVPFLAFLIPFITPLISVGGTVTVVSAKGIGYARTGRWVNSDRYHSDFNFYKESRRISSIDDPPMKIRNQVH